jgi:hypothetical protein
LDIIYIEILYEKSNSINYFKCIIGSQRDLNRFILTNLGIKNKNC